MFGGGLLDPLATHGELVCSQVHEVERVRDRPRRRPSLGGRRVKAGEPVHGHYLDPITERLFTSLDPLGHGLRRATLDRVEQPARVGASDHRGQIGQDGHKQAAAIAPDVPPLVLVHPKHADALEVAGPVVGQSGS